MRKLFLIIMLSSFVTSYLMAQDITVKKDGSILTVYNLEESNTSYFYSLEPSKDAPTQKLAKSEVFSVKKSDGTTVSQANGNSGDIDNGQPKREPVTAVFVENIKHKGYDNCFSAKTPNGHILNYAVMKDMTNAVMVIGVEGYELYYVIPEFVQMGENNYIVAAIDDNVFRFRPMQYVQFPNTLKRIGKNAFERCSFWGNKIILPEGLSIIEDEAFAGCNSRRPIEEIYLPSSVEHIGKNCFLECGTETSYRGFCQAYFSNMPRFINEGNCKYYGIDEEAVRAYKNSKK